MKKINYLKRVTMLFFIVERKKSALCFSVLKETALTAGDRERISY